MLLLAPWAGKGCWAQSPGAPPTPQQSAWRQEPASRTELELHTRLEYTRRGGRTQLYLNLTVNIPAPLLHYELRRPAGAAAAQQPHPQCQAEAWVEVLCIRPGGGLAYRGRRPFQHVLASSPWPEEQVATPTLRHPLPVGRYQLEVLLWSRGQLKGRIRRPLQATLPQGPVLLSDLALATQRLPGAPQQGGVLPAELDFVQVGVQVYSTRYYPLTARLTLYRERENPSGEQVLQYQSLQAWPRAWVLQQGANWWWLQLPLQGLEPGAYLLEVQLLDDSQPLAATRLPFRTAWKGLEELLAQPDRLHQVLHPLLTPQLLAQLDNQATAEARRNWLNANWPQAAANPGATPPWQTYLLQAAQLDSLPTSPRHRPEQRKWLLRYGPPDRRDTLPPQLGLPLRVRWFSQRYNLVQTFPLQ